MTELLVFAKMAGIGALYLTSLSVVLWGIFRFATQSTIPNYPTAPISKKENTYH